jgi:hypothetical protein
MIRVLAILAVVAIVVVVPLLVWHFHRVRSDRVQIAELSKTDPEALRLVVEQNARLEKRIPKGAVDELVKRKLKSDADDKTIGRFTAISERLLARSDAFDMGEEYDALRQLVEEQKTEEKVGK